MPPISKPVVNTKCKTQYIFELSGRKSSLENDNLRIRLKTDEQNGLVMVMRGGSVHGLGEEFLAVAINSGRPEVSLNLQKRQQQPSSTGGSTGTHRMLTLQATNLVSDGEWHTMQVLRQESVHK